MALGLANTFEDGSIEDLAIGKILQDLQKDVLVDPGKKSEKVSLNADSVTYESEEGGVIVYTGPLDNLYQKNENGVFTLLKFIGLSNDETGEHRIFANTETGERVVLHSAGDAVFLGKSRLTPANTSLTEIEVMPLKPDWKLERVLVIKNEGIPINIYIDRNDKVTYLITIDDKKIPVEAYTLMDDGNEVIEFTGGKITIPNRTDEDALPILENNGTTQELYVPGSRL